MEIRSFLYMGRKTIKLCLILTLLFVGCATKIKKPRLTPNESSATVSESGTITTAAEAESDDSAVEAVESMGKQISTSKKLIPKIGIIFSGGGVKAWAHIGFLKEIEKAKWPVHSVAGFEWGAVVAGIYGSHFSSNEVEWELSKVRDFKSISEISESIFSKKNVSELKVPFVCPSFNIAKQTLYLLNRGSLNKLIPFCLAMPPLSPPFAYSIAGLNEITALANHLRATGANKIVLVNVLSQNKKQSFTDDVLSVENILWSQSASQMSRKVAGVDDIVQIDLDDFNMKDLDRRREVIAKGAELSYSEVQKLSQKYGL